MRKLSASLRQLLRLDQPVAGLAAMKHGCASSAWWNPTSVLMPPISNSPSARSIRRRACSRSTPWTMSLATIGS